MDEARRIIERCFGADGDVLTVGGDRVDRLVERHGSPLFVYDRGVMTRSLDALRDALTDRFDVYYSIKANPAPDVVRVFLEAGCGLEIASDGELRRALDVGCDPGRILFAGPGKTRAEIDAAIDAGIGEIHAEGFDEIDVLSASAVRAGRVVPVALRINPSGEAQGGAMRMGGKPSPFGIDEEKLDAAVDRVRSAEGIEFSGVHLFVGTQILDAGTLVRQYQAGFEIGLRAARRAGAALHTLDFGGGLGIPYYRGETPLDLGRYGEGVADLLERHSRRPEFEGTRFLVEPGRFLVGESGVYLCRVTYVKESRGKTFVVTDGGMHHHLAASGNLGQIIKRNYPVAVVNRLGAAATTRVDVVGPLCTPLDVLARDVELPDVGPGDLVAVFQSGAYGRTASPSRFLGRAEAAEQVVP